MLACAILSLIMRLDLFRMALGLIVGRIRDFSFGCALLVTRDGRGSNRLGTMRELSLGRYTCIA